jgi:predicted permease
VYPRSWHFRARAVPLREQISGQLRPALLVLLGAVGLVLLIACANVAGLLFVRGERRRRETTLRAALGAARPRLVRQFLAEGLVLALVGGGLGVVLARLGVEATRAWAPASLPLVRDVSLNQRVLGFALATTLLTLVLFALAPALSGTRVHLTETLKDGGRGATAGRVRLRTRELLVVAEVALAVVLLVGGGLMIRTVQRMLSIDPGFRSERVLTMELSIPSARYPEDARVSAFYDELRRRVSRLPGVQAAGAARLLPLAAEIGDRGLFVEGYTPPPGEGTPGDWQVVTPGYFEAMGVKLLRGRFFDERDHAGGALSIIINRRLAEKYLAGRDPIGTRIQIGNRNAPPTTVVGVVESVQHNALTADVKPMFFAPHAQFPTTVGFAPRTMSLVVKTSGDPLTLVHAVREEVRALDPQIPVSQVRTMKEIVRASVAQQRFSMLLLGAFAGLALLLAIVGIYGVVAQVVTARASAFGVRAALGATPGNLVQLSLWSGLRQTVVGLALGAGAALALTRLMTGLLYGVAPTDPLTFALALTLTGLAATAASWIPARRAGRVNPANALVAS